MKKEIKVCAYCLEKISHKETYSRLGSGLLLHEGKNKTCGRDSFFKKTLRARWFRMKNRVLYGWFKLKFFIGYIYWARNRRKNEKVKKWDIFQ